jgi:hypothetical protein
MKRLQAELGTTVCVIVVLLGLVGCDMQHMAPINNDFNMPADMTLACQAPTPNCPSVVPMWSTQVSAIVQARCAGPCHSPGGVESTYPLTSYADVTAKRETVLDQVYGCLMPPPGNDLGATIDAADQATLISWLACGAPNN